MFSRSPKTEKHFCKFHEVPRSISVFNFWNTLGCLQATRALLNNLDVLGDPTASHKSALYLLLVSPNSYSRSPKAHFRSHLLALFMTSGACFSFSPKYLLILLISLLLHPYGRKELALRLSETKHYAHSHREEDVQHGFLMSLMLHTWEALGTGWTNLGSAWTSLYGQKKHQL